MHAPNFRLIGTQSIFRLYLYLNDRTYTHPPYTYISAPLGIKLYANFALWALRSQFIGSIFMCARARALSLCVYYARIQVALINPLSATAAAFAVIFLFYCLGWLAINNHIPVAWLQAHTHTAEFVRRLIKKVRSPQTSASLSSLVEFDFSQDVSSLSRWDCWGAVMFSHSVNECDVLQEYSDVHQSRERG